MDADDCARIVEGAAAVLDLLAAEFPGVPISLMAQYVPMGRVPADARYADATAASPRASTARCSTT